MKRLACFTLVLLLSTIELSARELRATSGEHADFSRIVVFFDTPSEWKVGRTERGYAFEYGGNSANFNISEIFQYIPRNRVLNVTHDSELQRLNFEIDCVCHIDAFELRNGHVALDFKDGEAEPDSQFETLFDPPQLTFLPARVSSANLVLLDSSRPPEALPKRNGAFHELLVRSLAGAVSDGRLEVAAIEGPMEPYQQSTDEREQVSVNNVRVTNSEIVESGNIAARECFNGMDLSFPELEEQGFSKISELRRGLFDGNLALSPSSIEGLLQHYLYMGLGAEVLALFTENVGLLEQQPELSQIARLVDGLPLVNSTFPKNQINCSGALTLWAILAGARPTEISVELENEMLRTLSEMPKHLQGILGPGVLQNLDPLTNASFQSRLSEFLSSTIDLTQNGNDNLQGLELSNLSVHELLARRRGNDQSSDLATLELAQRALSDNIELPVEFLDDLETRSYELRESELGIEFLKLLALLGSERGFHTRAVKALIELRGQSHDEFERASVTIFDNLTRTANNEIFASEILKNRSILSDSPLVPPTLNGILDRLVDLGLAKLAVEISEELPVSVQQKNQLKSIAASVEYRPDEAFAFVMNDLSQTGLEMFYLNAPTRSFLGDDIARAVQHIELEEAQRYLWLSGRAQLVSEVNDTAYSIASSLVNSQELADISDKNTQELRMEDFAQVHEKAVSRRMRILEMVDMFNLSVPGDVNE